MGVSGRWVGHYPDCAQSVRENEALVCPQKGTSTISVIGEVLGNGVASMCWGGISKYSAIAGSVSKALKDVRSCLQIFCTAFLWVLYTILLVFSV